MYNILRNLNFPMKYVRTMSEDAFKSDGRTKVIGLAATGNVVDWWPDGKNNTGQMFTTTLCHGNDEDGFWGGSHEYFGPGISTHGTPSLLYTRSSARTRPASMSPSAVRQAIIAKGGSREKENLFLTCIKACLIDHRTREEIDKLSKSFNIVANVHYFGKSSSIHPSIITLDSDEYPYSISRVDAADVIVGYPGGLVSSSTGFLNKPLVEITKGFVSKFTKESFLDTMNDKKKYEKNGQFLLNNRSAEVVFDPSVELSDAVFRAIDTKSNEKKAKEKERHKYFERLYRCIDGYEDYRLWFIILRDAQLDPAKIQTLEDLYPSLKGARCPQGKWLRKNWKNLGYDV